MPCPKSNDWQYQAVVRKSIMIWYYLWYEIFWEAENKSCFDTGEVKWKGECDDKVLSGQEEFNGKSISYLVEKDFYKI